MTQIGLFNDKVCDGPTVGDFVAFTLIGAGMSPGAARVAIHGVSDEGIEMVIEVTLADFVAAGRTMADLAGTLGDPSVPW